MATTTASNPHLVLRPRADGRGKSIRCDLYTSSPDATPAADDSTRAGESVAGPRAAGGAALFLHGFGGRRHHLACHARALVEAAARLSGGGALPPLQAFVPDLTSMTEGGTCAEIWRDRNVRSAQVTNVTQVVAHAEYLQRLQLPPRNRLALVGHSAGGAVALEAAVTLQEAGTPPAVVVLLDAVPWAETIEVAARFNLAQTRLVSIRCEPSAWNKKGASLVDALARIPRRSRTPKVRGGARRARGVEATVPQDAAASPQTGQDSHPPSKGGDTGEAKEGKTSGERGGKRGGKTGGDDEHYVGDRLIDIKLVGARHGDAMPPSCVGKMLCIVGVAGSFGSMRDLTLAALCDALVGEGECGEQEAGGGGGGVGGSGGDGGGDMGENVVREGRRRTLDEVAASLIAEGRLVHVQ